MGTRGVQTKGLNVLSTRVSHLYPEPKQVSKVHDAPTVRGMLRSVGQPMNSQVVFEGVSISNLELAAARAALRAKYERNPTS